MKEVTPKQAHDILQKDNGAVLIDVRSTMEFEYVGHPLNALHIPIKQPPDWQIEENFAESVNLALKQQFPAKTAVNDVPLLMLCRSGARSATAAEILINQGYTTVYNVIEGFEGDKDEKGQRSTINGWRFHKLPWEQS